MTNDAKFRDEKLQYDINREAAKISELSSGKIDKYEYPTGEEYYLLVKRECVYIFNSLLSIQTPNKNN